MSSIQGMTEVSLWLYITEVYTMDQQSHHDKVAKDSHVDEILHLIVEVKFFQIIISAV